MSSPDREKLLQYLNEAHATEASLVQVLTAHIGVTPRGRYRDLLERHRAETVAQRDRLQERLTELGVTRNPLQVAYGLVQTTIGQALAVGKLPLDLLRGGSGEEKLLKNAKDEAMTEALEIATYDSLEAMADALGDQKTATLAREHRTQEETFLRDLRDLIPSLTGAVADAEVRGEPSYDASTTGAADAVRRTATKARDAAEDAAEGAVAEVKGAGRFARRQAEVAQENARDAGDDGGTGDDASASDEASGPDAAERRAQAEGTAPVADDLDDLPIEGYASLTVEQALPKLRTLSAAELARIDGYERANRNRKRILDRVAALRAKRTEEELAQIP